MKTFLIIALVALVFLEIAEIKSKPKLNDYPVQYMPGDGISDVERGSISDIHISATGSEAIVIYGNTFCLTKSNGILIYEEEKQ